MIAKVGILIVLLSGDGHWFGGSHEAAAFRWAVLSGAPDVQINWELTAGPVAVAQGKLGLQGNVKKLTHGKPPIEESMAEISVPEVRVATEMTFHYRAVDAGNQHVDQTDECVVHVYPRDLLASAARRLRGREIYLWDVPDGLPALFKQAKIAHTAFDDPRQLQFVRPDILIVAAGQVSRHPEGQSKMLNLAAAGTGVLVLGQSNLPSLCSYPLVPRKPPERLDVLDDHPLMRHLDRRVPCSASPLWALELPVEAAVLPIAWWPREYPSQRAAAVDALLASQSLGRGRIVYCQYPLGPWQRDPRSQLFLDDALDYLLSPVAPTTVAAIEGASDSSRGPNLVQNQSDARHEIVLPTRSNGGLP